jgi:hypothetical protein
LRRRDTGLTAPIAGKTAFIDRAGGCASLLVGQAPFAPDKEKECN